MRVRIRLGFMLAGYGARCPVCGTVFRCSRAAAWTRCPDDRFCPQRNAFKVQPHRIVGRMYANAVTNREPLFFLWEVLVARALVQGSAAQPGDLVVRDRLFALREDPSLPEAVLSATLMNGEDLTGAQELEISGEALESIAVMCG